MRDRSGLVRDADDQNAHELAPLLSVKI
jgi:hypothetical protein